MAIWNKVIAFFMPIISFFTSILITLGLLVPAIPTNSFNEAKFITAINAKDIATLESMICQNIKDKYANLPVLLTEFCDVIDQLTDGGLVDYKRSPAGSIGQSDRGNMLDQYGYDFGFGEPCTTFVGDVPIIRPRYRLTIQWQTRNSFSFAETGLRWIFLMDNALSGEDRNLINIKSTGFSYPPYDNEN